MKKVADILGERSVRAVSGGDAVTGVIGVAIVASAALNAMLVQGQTPGQYFQSEDFIRVSVGQIVNLVLNVIIPPPIDTIIDVSLMVIDHFDAYGYNNYFPRSYVDEEMRQNLVSIRARKSRFVDGVRRRVPNEEVSAANLAEILAQFEGYPGILEEFLVAFAADMVPVDDYLLVDYTARLCVAAPDAATTRTLCGDTAYLAAYNAYAQLNGPAYTNGDTVELRRRIAEMYSALRLKMSYEDEDDSVRRTNRTLAVVLAVIALVILVVAVWNS